MNILVSWIGGTDLSAMKGEETAGLGPIGQVVATREWDRIQLLNNYRPKLAAGYDTWLASKTSAKVHIEHISLSSPIEFGEIYEAATKAVDQIVATFPKADLTFHISPGTPAMVAVWILLGKTRYPAQLIQSSREQGAMDVLLPFDISAEYLPNLLRPADERLKAISGGIAATETTFGDLTFKSRSMTDVVSLAKRIALHSVPVLIEGETGTGKELFARAIHNHSPRNKGPFVSVNCGAIAGQLVESELFGHTKGAFTDASAPRKGHFVEANGGSIFLDELGELPLSAQVKLLRVIQEGEVTPVGSSTPTKIDVRVISATHKNVINEVVNRRFREDLFYRLAVFVLKLPPLRDREGDLTALAKIKMGEINRSSHGVIWPEDKELSPGALNRLQKHNWPGNVRELEHTLQRAAVIANGPRINEHDIERALLPLPADKGDLLGRSLGEGFDLRELLSDVTRHYLKRALDESGDNKSRAARLLGIKNYQTLSNWTARLGIRDSETR